MVAILVAGFLGFQSQKGEIDRLNELAYENSLSNVPSNIKSEFCTANYWTDIFDETIFTLDDTPEFKGNRASFSCEIAVKTDLGANDQDETYSGSVVFRGQDSLYTSRSWLFGSDLECNFLADSVATSYGGMDVQEVDFTEACLSSDMYPQGDLVAVSLFDQRQWQMAAIFELEDAQDLDGVVDQSEIWAAAEAFETAVLQELHFADFRSPLSRKSVETT